ncbi:MAG: cupredoxin domain-containing protein [Candidatus Methanoculleus thermohydrogenotrophicum]
MPPAGEEGAISITASGFDPDTLTVPTDTTVTWTNAADTNQTITLTGPTGSIDLGALEPGDSADYTFSDSR